TPSAVCSFCDDMHAWVILIDYDLTVITYKPHTVTHENITAYNVYIELDAPFRTNAIVDPDIVYDGIYA
ncbi:hypothetical protein ACXNAO_007092, partial [Pseudomonas aeruginosa]